MPVTCAVVIAGVARRKPWPAEAPLRRRRRRAFRAIVRRVRAARPRPSSPLSALLLAVSAALGGCDDLASYGGSYGESRVVRGDFVRSCFADDTKLKLEFAPDRLLDPQAGPPLNRITTTNYDLFADTPLEPIAKLDQDHLSEFDFSGPQRLRNYMLYARPSSGPLAGRDALVVISLLASESVEVRIMARSADDAAPCSAAAEATDAGAAAQPGRREYFGLWRLKK